MTAASVKRLATSTALLAAIVATARGQEADRLHRAMSLSQPTHGLVHAGNMTKLLRHTDSTLQRAQLLAQRTAERVREVPGSVERFGAIPQMSQSMTTLTAQLEAMTAQMRAMMTDESMIQSRPMQADMEDVSSKVAALADKAEATLKTIDRMSVRAASGMAEGRKLPTSKPSPE